MPHHSLLDVSIFQSSCVGGLEELYGFLEVDRLMGFVGKTVPDHMTDYI